MSQDFWIGAFCGAVVGFVLGAIRAAWIATEPRYQSRRDRRDA